MIDLDMMPPDWKFAEEHAKANKPGLVDDRMNPFSSNLICPCCLKPIIKNEIPLLSNSKQMEFMGFGFPLYFIFIKYCIILLLVLICSYSTISVYLGIKETSEFCSHTSRLLESSSSAFTVCSSLFIEISRINPTVDSEQILLRITSFVINLLALLYIRDNINKTMNYYNERTTSLSDFSLIIRNLPLREGVQNSIKAFILNHFKEKWDDLKQTNEKPEFQEENKVAQITLLPQIQDYYKLQVQKNEVIEEKRKLFKEYEELEKLLNAYPSPSSSTLQQLANLKAKIRNTNQKINLLNVNIAEISLHMRSMAKQDVLMSQIAIVTFTNQIFMAEVLQAGSIQRLNSRTLGEYFGEFEGQLSIQKAPEPSQIIWRNANVSTKKVFFRKLLSWALSFVFIALVTVGFYFLLITKTNYLLAAIDEEHKTNDPTSTTQSYKIALFLEYFHIFLIIFFNKFLMGTVLHYLTHIENQFSTAAEEFSFALKYTLGMFFTTALMTLAVEAITFHNVYQHEFGVVQEEFIIFILNAALIPIIWLVNPWQIIKLIGKKLKKGSKCLTQREANEIMCDTSYAIGKRYAQIIKTMWFTYLYASLIPIGSFFSVVGLGFYYWVDKFNLLKRSSLSHNISGDLAVVSLKLLDFTLVLKPAGEMIFDYLIRHQVEVQSIILVAMGGLYLILPIDGILQFFHRQDFNQVAESYDQVKDTFLETYQTMHPILSFKALKVLDNMRRKSTKEIVLNQIQITLAELSPTKSPNRHEYMNSNNRIPSFRSESLMQKSFLDESAEHEYSNYEFRSKINKTASKNYFASKYQSKKEHQVLPPFLR